MSFLCHVIRFTEEFRWKQLKAFKESGILCAALRTRVVYFGVTGPLMLAEALEVLSCSLQSRRMWSRFQQQAFGGSFPEMLCDVYDVQNRSGLYLTREISVMVLAQYR